MTKRINDKCVSLSIMECEETINRIKQRSDFKDPNFNKPRHETKEDIESFFSNKILSGVKYILHPVKKYVAILFKGITYLYDYSWGIWTSSDKPDKFYYTSNIRELTWKYAIGPYADQVKESYRNKQELIEVINNI